MALFAGMPVAAQANPTVMAPDRCYISWPGKGSQSIPITVDGLAAGQQVRLELRVRGTTVSGVPSLTADSAGALQTTLTSWTSGLDDGPSRGVGATLAISDVATGAQVASTPVQIANAGLDIDTGTKRFGAPTRWVVSGLSRLTGGPAYYAYYFKDGKQIGHQRLGKAGPCGYLSTKAPLVPFSQLGTFEFRVQASAKFRRSMAWAGGTVTQKKRSTR